MVFPIPAASVPWIVAVGASGPDGLGNIRDLLAALGPRPDAVVMVVLHRPFDKPSRLRDVLQSATRMPVIVATDGEKLDAGACYIGEPASHLKLMASRFGEIAPDPDRIHRNRTVDLLFKSVALFAAHRAIGVILSGELDDGARGVEAIHHAGGKTMVLLRHPQFRGMPENAIAYDGPIDEIGSTQAIALAILCAISGKSTEPAALEANRR